MPRDRFTAAPVPLAFDEQGREVLSFVPGDVPRQPLSPETAGDDVLILPAALIDFDLARPTTRLYDIGNALWWWAPLRDPQDRAPASPAPTFRTGRPSSPAPTG